MRVIRNYKDYYDSALVPAYDKRDIVWDRKVSEIKKVSISLDTYTVDYIRLAVIVFCGKAWLLLDESSFGSTLLAPERTLVPEKVLYGAKDIYEKRVKKDAAYSRSLGWFHFRSLKGAYKDLEQKLNRIDWHPYHRELKTPVFAFSADQGKRRDVIINPKLYTYKFATQVGVFEAAQELDMYVSNFLVDVAPLQPMSDEVIKEAKGFGHKYAFKKEPGQKKRKKHR